MTNIAEKKPRKLAWEILGLIAISAAAAVVLFSILSWIAAVIAESYCFYYDVEMTEFDWIETDRWIFSVSAVISCGFFMVLFLSLLADRIVYIRKLTQGIRQLQQEDAPCTIPLEGRNELTLLACAIHEMWEKRQQLREKEQELAEEKEKLIRTLSHDIRTPLTSVLSYTEYLLHTQDLPRSEQEKYLELIRKKGEQIRDLTQLLLDGGTRSSEHFADARLLMAQLAAEFEAALEDGFSVKTELSGCPSFAGSFDVQELRRIFDNLSSNVAKYADPACPVQLRIWVAEGMHILQSNAVAKNAPREDSYRLGLNSIRRIAQYYGGRVEIRQDDENFDIHITLLDY